MKKCLTILLKGLSGLSLSLLLAGFIGITSAKAWEQCGYDNYGPTLNQNSSEWTWTTPYQLKSDIIQDIYIYNKCNPNQDWQALSSNSVLHYKIFGVNDASQSIFNGQSVNEWAFYPLPNSISNNAANYGSNSSYNFIHWNVAAEDTSSVTGDYYAQQLLCLTQSWYGTNSTGCFYPSGQTPTDNCICVSNVEPGGTPPEPVSNNYVMYYGNDPAYGKISERLSMPIVYNICDDWSSTSTFQIKLRATSTKELLATANVLNNCSGTIKFNGIAAAEESSQYAYFSIEKNGTELIKSDQFLFTIYEPLINADNWINSDLSSPLYIDYTTTNTTTAKITYRIFYNNIASTSICLIRKDQN